jgi:hypothetical protein
MNPCIKTPKPPLLIVLLAAINIMMTLTGCNYNRLDGCEGDIIVENEIPDLVMRLGDEPFQRDVFEDPVVFRHTHDQVIDIGVRSVSGGIIVTATRVLNPQTNIPSIVKVTPRSVGETIVEIEANDNCFDRRRFTTFKVTIIENEEENND